MPHHKKQQQKIILIGKAAAIARRRYKGEQGKNAARFIDRFFSNVPPDDILKETPEDLASIACGHLEFADKRPAERALVRVFNPTMNKHGWVSEHTVIEIVNDDMPFLVDSITSEIGRQDLTVHLAIHPIFTIIRDGGGKLREIRYDDGSADTLKTESFIHIEATRQSGKRLDEIRSAINNVLVNVRAAVNDWQAMRDNMASLINELKEPQSNVDASDIDDIHDFLQWVHEDHFTFLGFREYEFKGTGRKAIVSINHKVGLGVLRDCSFDVFRELRDLASMPPEVRAFVNKPDLLMITKTNQKSNIHRPVCMDAIGVKRFDKKGRVVALRLFVGLFTSHAYNMSPRKIPLLSRKIDNTFERSGFTRSSHDGKALLNIIETFPRDELFQISEEHLYLTSLGILNLQERQRVALFIRRDEFERFISCLIYVPRDNYNTLLREKFQKILEDAFAGEIQDFYTQLGDSPLARLHVIVKTKAGNIPDYDPEKIEEQLVMAARSWNDLLCSELISRYGEEEGLYLFRRYRNAFRPGYQARFNADSTVKDIAEVEKAIATKEISMRLSRPSDAPARMMWFKVFNPHGSVPLSDIIPMMEHMGLKVNDEMPYSITPEGLRRGELISNDFGLETRDGSDIDLDRIRDNFQDAFRRVWRGEVESDGFNALALNPGLNWREVALLRAFCKYLRQTGIAFSQSYMEQTLCGNPDLSRMIVDMFIAKFDPEKTGKAKSVVAKIKKKIDKGLNAVSSADEDRILRRFVNLVESTLRTNYFQTTPQGQPKSYISLKLDSSMVEELPLPRPMVEVFVYSPRVEAIHLRGGKVARGGIRWSDRREDFRTEVLGLMKAQMVKNAVIVPVGSKGGFVVKCPPTEGGREALINEGIECYKTLMRGLLDITDNLKGNRVLPPVDVVRYDDDDPYLVVAADKGTATFSDIANSVSDDYGFWLGDAFASGGSVGYDHKKMGITARGAWESVKRHFREIGTDIQKQDFTVVGVGDMSGDVFGNGMLLSKHIKLIAAFNHLHIFVDPDPDIAKSFAERKRLFNLPRSSWGDYNRKLLSKGGDIFDRSAKVLRPGSRIKNLFGITRDQISPNELIKAILCAEVDLLWFGGIGTYIKASSETHVDAGDRGNDAVRIDATELRCKVIGEGANMGVTQRARIEGALCGCRLNTDAIDNSAGVDCSDNEVNIKILVNSLVANGRLTEKRRNSLLASMTKEVGKLVLRDNYMQTQAITMIQTSDVLDDQIRLMRMMEREGRLDRAIEFLPDEETLEERAAKNLGLVRPEISVLLSYSKMWLYDQILDSNLPDDKHLAEDLVRYFPTPLRDKYHAAIGRHRLRREIIATHVTNSMINRVGGTFVHRLMERTGLSAPDIARAYIISRQVFGLRTLWKGIEDLDGRVDAATQTMMFQDINRLIEWVTVWFLRNGRRPLDITSHINEFADGIARLTAELDKAIPAHYRKDVKKRARPYIEKGVGTKLALRISGLVNLFPGCDIVRLAKRRRLTVPRAAQLYFAIGTRFRLDRLRAATELLESESHWQKLAAASLVEEIYDHQLALASRVLDMSGTKPKTEAAIKTWIKGNAEAVERVDRLLAELWSSEVNDFSMIAVASGQLRALADSAS